MTEKKQCTNPFIILFCQRLVRAGWSQHVCGAPSCPPPPGEGPGEQLGAVAEKAWGEQSTVWQGLGWARLRLFPHTPCWGASSGSWDVPRMLAQGSLPRPRGPVCPALGWGQPDSPGLAALSPVLALLQGAERGPWQRSGGLSAQRCRWPQGRGNSGGWECEQRTQGRME